MEQVVCAECGGRTYKGRTRCTRCARPTLQVVTACKACGGAVEKSRHGRRQHCSPECRRRWAYELGPNVEKVQAGIRRRGIERWEAYRAANPRKPPKVIRLEACIRCGQAVGKWGTKFCSLSCSVKEQMQSDPRRRHCEGCGAVKSERKGVQQGKVYLCPPCKGVAARLKVAAIGWQRLWARVAMVQVHSCEWCQGWFLTTKPKAVTCNPTCRKRRNRQSIADWRKRNPEKMTALRSRVMAKRRRPTKWSPDRTWLMTRDNGQCGICKRPVRVKYQWPDKRSASVDHIVPLANGGEHSPENVQLAHLGCNLRRNKRGRAYAQLRLVA